MTYLIRDQNGTYYFRKVIPPKLRPHMPAPWTGKVNFKRSLETKNPRGAKIKASRVLSECTAAFQMAERALTGAHAKELHDPPSVACAAHTVRPHDLKRSISEIVVPFDG